MPTSRSNLINGQNITEDEYGEFYGRYIKKSRGKNLFTRFDEGQKQVIDLLQSLDEEQAYFRYAEEKWTIKEVAGHMIDTERIMAFRALTFARGDTYPLPGFDQDKYVKSANFNSMQLDDLMELYSEVRSSTRHLFSSFSDEMLMAKGSASNSEFSVRALGFVIAGHEIHHLEIFRDKYLPGLV
jgi:uncharacterized damage-inducible protein DinB